MTFEDFLESYPSFSNGTLSLNGVEKVRTTKTGNTVNSNYNLSDFEKLALEYAQENIAQNLPQLNVFSADTQKDINNQVNAFKNNAIKEINSVYEPMLNSLKNDIASRFGSFSNSTFMNNLNDIESKRSDAIAALAQDVTAKKSELEDEELSRRYDYLDFLNDYQNSFYENLLDMVSTTQTNSKLGNSYTNDAVSNYLYNQKLNSDSNNYNNRTLLSALLKTFS